MHEYYNYKNAHFKGHPEIYFFHAAGHKKLAQEDRIKTYLESKGIK